MTEVTSDHVIVDSTPPTVGNVIVGTVTHNTVISGKELHVTWNNVMDEEAGIHSIEVGN